MSTRKRPFMTTTPGSGSKNDHDLGIQQPSSQRLRLESSSAATAAPLPSNLDQIEVQSLRAELEHERSLRTLDKRRAEQHKKRLESRLKLAAEEAEQNKLELDELREETDQHIQQVRESRNDALMQLRECQIALEQAEEEAQLGSEVSRYKQKMRMLQSHLNARDEQIEGLQKNLNDAQKELKEKLAASLSTPTKDRKNYDDDESDGDKKNIGGISPAPTAVLKELNKTRIQLAESDRRYRQLCRKSEDWHSQSKLYIEERERARAHEARVHQLELETRELTKKFEAAWAAQQSWTEFGVHLQKVLQVKVGTNHGFEKKEDAVTSGPMEIATVKRGLDEMAERTKRLELDKAEIQRQLDAAQKGATALEKQIQNDTEAQVRASKSQKETEIQLERAERDLETLRAQEGIWKNEAESLRNLLETCDQVGSAKQQLTKSDLQTYSVSVKALESSLQATRDEVRLLMEARDRLSDESESHRNENKDLQKELTRVTEKFGRLREALLKERAKAEEADARAAKAEALAGKGSYNADETRALHLQNNPLTEALKEKYQAQIDALQKRLEEAESHTSAKTPGGTTLATSSSSSAVRPDVDPHKLHKRLKESFKEQIGLFREGVYLMTGYKVDMLPNTERPTFRVRSMYAEQEQDHLLFVWPKPAGDSEVVSLDLVETDQAKILSATDSYQYMTKFNSLPAFLASVQLGLFEKQTFAG
mmetsp:Transcript_18098/g.27979  ORF Transcript_18098/g.27979 Transcript_18098/m.27979 type:complete len:710 (-) Transcript_18098:114-2243(-)|eukprot:CAMPEP_0195289462 /NCGR_PEP_ID=MMETSP0707-20130614/5730_1 /TAXON_ID=33640 /ORGANISM="Asterionellopsis glacialis, Strain CCMP134" /LENGTH=709 /DNA_ID=CAMNT_0040349473 /DNA_START=52 /DNA_END=2181 /DNA_ORIENTATION=+